MKDFVSQELAVGDRVVHAVGGRHGGLSGGGHPNNHLFVHSFTPQMVRLAYRNREDHHTIVPPGNLVKVRP